MEVLQAAGGSHIPMSLPAGFPTAQLVRHLPALRLALPRTAPNPGPPGSLALSWLRQRRGAAELVISAISGGGFGSGPETALGLQQRLAVFVGHVLHHLPHGKLTGDLTRKNDEKS